MNERKLRRKIFQQYIFQAEAGDEEARKLIQSLMSGTLKEKNYGSRKVAVQVIYPDKTTQQFESLKECQKAMGFATSSSIHKLIASGKTDRKGRKYEKLIIRGHKR